jgi:hypothetical protein
MRGGARKGTGPKGPHNREKRKKDTITLHKRDWEELDKLGPSRGKAVEKLIKFYSQVTK